MENIQRIAATIPGPHLNVVRSDGEQLSITPKIEIPGCSFRINRPGRVEVYLYPNVQRARDVARPSDNVVPTDDGRAWLTRWTD